MVLGPVVFRPVPMQNNGREYVVEEVLASWCPGHGHTHMSKHLFKGTETSFPFTKSHLNILQSLNRIHGLEPSH
jgi:hypothetical protein